MNDSQIQQHKPEGELFIDFLRESVNSGIPIFTQDTKEMKNDIVRSMYYAVKAQLPNYNVVFLHGGVSLLDLTWLVDEDPYGLCDRIACVVETKYIRGTSDNEYLTQIQIQQKDPHVSVLSNQEVNDRWNLMKSILPRKEFAPYGDQFDVTNWYSMITHGMR